MCAHRHFGADAAQAHDQDGLALQVCKQRRATGTISPLGLLLLSEEIIQMSAQHQHHAHHMLCHAGAEDTLHVRDQQLMLANQRLLRAALDAGVEQLYPPQAAGLLKNFRRADANGDFGSGDVRRCRVRGELNDAGLRRDLLQLLQVVVQFGRDQDEMRRPPQTALAHRLRVHEQTQIAARTVCGAHWRHHHGAGHGAGGQHDAE